MPLAAAELCLLSRLLDQAFDLPSNEIEPWLCHLPEGQSHLAPRLRDMLAEHRSGVVSTFMADGPKLSHTAAHDSAARVGELVGPYRLIRKIGQGGMGAVWLAERADGVFERQVALKLPLAEWTDRGLAQRLARERAVLASLNHPNIGQLFDAGTAESGQPYLALEYVEGESIDAWCANHELDTRKRLRLFVEVVRAVAYAHAQLVVHRDLKPSNVLVTTEGRIKLLDFGIAKLLATDTSSVDETELTRLGGRPLTLNYAAPEQILGQPISTATDIYALGVMLFELLSGERPYRLIRDSRGALEDAIVHGDLLAPSSVAKEKSAQRALHGDLDAITLKALKKAPEQRYETAAAFADDIERYLGRLPVRAQRDSRMYRATRFLVRHKLAVGAVSSVIVALAAGLSLALWQAQEAKEQAERASTINDFVLSVIKEADPVASRQMQNADVALLAAAAKRVEGELKGRPDIALKMRLAIGAAYSNRSQYEHAREILRTALDGARQFVPEDNLDLLRAKVGLAATHALMGDDIPEIDKDIEVLRRLGDPAAPILVDALLARSWFKRGVFEFAGAREDASEAYDIAQRLFAPDDERIVSTAWAIARALMASGDTKGALKTIESAYTRVRNQSKLEPSHPVVVRTESLYGYLLSVSGKSSEGIPILKQSVQTARATYGPESRVTSDALGWLARAYRSSGELKLALSTYDEQARFAEVLLGQTYFRNPFQWSARIYTLLEARRPDEAHRHFQQIENSIRGSPAGKGQKALEQQLEAVRTALLVQLGETQKAETLLRHEVETFDRIGTAEWSTNARWKLAVALRQNGKWTEAEQLLAELCKCEAGKGRVGPGLSRVVSEYALLSLDLQRPEQALDLAQRGLANYLRVIRPLVPFVSDLQVARGRALMILNRPEEARDALKMADAFWRDFDPDNPWAAEAAYWFGRSLLLTGEAARGKRMIAESKPRLAASPIPLHRALVAPSGQSRPGLSS